MKIAVVGGTHGNEPVGVEVVKALNKLNPKSFKNEFKTFIGNPEAYKLKKRFKDSDLNRAFGKNSKPIGYEKERALEFEGFIKGKFDLLLDLHTTTTNMGETAILNNTNPLTQKVCCFLKSQNPEMKLIEEDKLDLESTHLNRLAPAGITIEFGPVANNVVSGDLVLKMYKMVLSILDWDFKEDFNYFETEVYETKKPVYYPDKEGWFVHPDVEGNDFKALKGGTPLFINIHEEVVCFKDKGEGCYPFFINEAAYQDNKIALFLAKKRN